MMEWNIQNAYIIGIFLGVLLGLLVTDLTWNVYAKKMGWVIHRKLPTKG